MSPVLSGIIAIFQKLFCAFVYVLSGEINESKDQK